MKSIWKAEVELPKRTALHDSVKVQNVVIGSGMAGILTAWLLQRKGQEVIVVDADQVVGGQTTVSDAGTEKLRKEMEAARSLGIDAF